MAKSRAVPQRTPGNWVNTLLTTTKGNEHCSIQSIRKLHYTTAMFHPSSPTKASIEAPHCTRTKEPNFKDPHALPENIVVKIIVNVKVMVKIKKSSWSVRQTPEVHKRCPNKSAKDVKTAQRPSLNNGSVPSTIPHESTHASPALHQNQRVKLQRSACAAQKHCGEDFFPGKNRLTKQRVTLSPFSAAD